LESIPVDLRWWQSLSPDWKKAFAETFFMHSNEPTSQELARLYESTTLRFAGPAAPYPNMSVQLEDLSGIVLLKNLEILVVTHHRIPLIQELNALTQLKSLFLFNNGIQSLEGIERLTALRQLYVQHNCIESILPVQSLTNLEELYINDNLVNSLKGLTEAHSEKLEKFFCKPNDRLKQKEILNTERELGIRCRSL